MESSSLVVISTDSQSRESFFPLCPPSPVHRSAPEPRRQCGGSRPGYCLAVVIPLWCLNNRIFFQIPPKLAEQRNCLIATTASGSRPLPAPVPPSPSFKGTDHFHSSNPRISASFFQLFVLFGILNFYVWFKKKGNCITIGMVHMVQKGAHFSQTQKKVSIKIASR